MSGDAFSYVVRVTKIPAGGRHFRLAADEAARRRLAEALGISAIGALTAELAVTPLHGGTLSVRGALSATVTQTDVVTLDPIEQAVEEEIDLTLVAAEDAAPESPVHEALVDAEAPDPPDLYCGNSIDLGAIVGEHLALALDPYPRAPGVDFEPHLETQAEPAESPFAALARLKNPSG